MPRRWPRPHGTRRVERAHAERRRARSMRGRVSGVGRRGDRRDGPLVGGSGRGRRSGAPRPSSTRPSSASPTAMRNGAAGRRARGVPGPIPSQLAERHQQRAACRGSRRPRRAPAASRAAASPTMQTSPTSASSPVASMISPIRSPTTAVAAGQVALRGSPASPGRGRWDQMTFAVPSSPPSGSSSPAWSESPASAAVTSSRAVCTRACCPASEAVLPYASAKITSPPQAARSIAPVSAMFPPLALSYCRVSLKWVFRSCQPSLFPT